MANTKQARKRSRQSEKHRTNNKWQMTRMNTCLKAVLAAIAAGDVTAAQGAYRNASAEVDKMATKGLIHRNKAARHKSRLQKHINKLAQGAAA